MRPQRKCRNRTMVEATIPDVIQELYDRYGYDFQIHPNTVKGYMKSKAIFLKPGRCERP